MLVPVGVCVLVIDDETAASSPRIGFGLGHPIPIPPSRAIILRRGSLAPPWLGAYLTRASPRSFLDLGQVLHWIPGMSEGDVLSILWLASVPRVAKYLLALELSSVPS